MAPGSAKTVRIGPVPTSGQQTALELLLKPLAADSRRREAERLRRSAAEGRLSLSGLLEACRGPERLGVVWAQLQPGRTAVIWTPQTTAAIEAPRSADRSDAIAERLIQAAVDCAAAAGARLAQALLPSRDAPAARWFEAAGMRHLAELDYLVWPAAPLRAATHPAEAKDAGAELTALSYCEDRDRPRLQEILTRTFQHTQDCPALDGVRDPDDVLRGYRAVGDSETKYWYLLQSAGADAGCLLLSDDEEAEQLELVYMGLAPEFRGRGGGRAATRWAQQVTRAAGRQRLVLAVDAANAPAQATYLAAGFVCWDRRSVLLRLFP